MSIATVVLFVVAVATSPSDEPAPKATPAPAATESESPSANVEPAVATTDVPELKGLGHERAAGRLRAAGLQVGEITRKQTAVRPGTVLAQGVAAGTSVDVDTEIALVIAVPFPRIPAVIGQTAAAAEAKLRRDGYPVKRIYRTRTSGHNGEVLSQTPRSGVPRRKGTLVTLTILRVVAPPPPPPPPPPQPANCTPGYSPCLPPAPDYDCAGGSGDGPKYTGPVLVTGSDPYGLDADGNGSACDW